MLALIVVLFQMAFDVTAATDLLALKTDPVFLGVTAVNARRGDREVGKFLNRQDVFGCAVRTLTDWRDSKHAHDRAALWFIISLLLFFDLLFFLYLQIVDSLCEFVDLNLSFHGLLAFFNSIV